MKAPGTIAGFGIVARGLPGEWPASRGPVHHEITWTTLDEPFAASGDWWWSESDDCLTVCFPDEGEYRASARHGSIGAVLGPANEREAALSFVLAVLPLSLPLFGLEPFHGAALELMD